MGKLVFGNLSGSLKISKSFLRIDGAEKKTLYFDWVGSVHKIMLSVSVDLCILSVLGISQLLFLFSHLFTAFET